MTRFVTAAAPVRIADLGGWTDTWFAGHGLVCNVAVRPGVEVHLAAAPAAGSTGVVAIDLTDDAEGRLARHRAGHPLVDAAIEEIGVDPDLDLTITVHSEIPAGASTGTSASLLVALVGALAHLRGTPVSAREAATRAHRVESVRLGLQTGIQDQLAAAHGGINRIAMSSYPEAAVTPVAIATHTMWELERRLLLVFLGRRHDSSAVHDAVIADLESAGARAREARLDPLRAAAAAGAAALEAGDVSAYGAALVANTEAQSALHGGLVDPQARRLIEIARRAGAVGWKVNGAGGPGGSLALLAPPGAGGRRRLADRIRHSDPNLVPIPTTIDTEGLRVWSTPG